MSEHECKGCEEYERLTRRNFVGLSAGFVVTALSPAWLPRVVFAESESSSRDVIVSIFLRGGSDGLTLCVPHGESAYYDLRPNLAIAPPDSSDGDRAIDLDGFFGLPPSMRALEEVYGAGDLLMVHATGLKETTRSHFDAMHMMEVGMLNPPGTLTTGWLGRHLASTAPTDQDAVLRAVGIGFGLQRTLVGAPQALPIEDLAAFGFEGPRPSRSERREALEAMYAAAAEPVKSSATNSFKTIDLLKRIGFRSYKPAGGAKYPDDEFGYALESTAALIKADVGVEAVAIDAGGWDTHDFQGPKDGNMAFLMESLSGGMAAFHADMTAANRTDFVVTTTSEFGRNAFENGSAGTDHGHGGVMMVMGGSVAGGKVLTEWPGLENGQLYEGQDLEITIDYRDILTEIITKRLGNPDYRGVFTDASYRPIDYGVTA